MRAADLSAARRGALAPACVEAGVVGALLAPVFLARLGALDVPLERDEGAYAYIAAQWRSGLIPYRDVFDHKPPLVYLVYAAVLTVRDQSPEAVRLAASVYFLGAVLAVWLLARAVLPPALALLATALFAALGSSHLIEGTDLNTEHLLVLPATLACYLALVAVRRQAPALAGLSGALLACAIAAKPVGALVALPVALAYVWSPAPTDRRLPRGALTLAAVAGLLVGLGPWLLYFALHGALGDLLYAVVVYNGAYAAEGLRTWLDDEAGQAGLRRFARPLWLPVGYAPLFGVAALVAACVRPRGRRPGLLVVVAYFLVSWAGARLAGRNFPHYFVPALPGLAVLVAYAVGQVWRPPAPWSGWRHAAARLLGGGGIVVAVGYFVLANVPFWGKAGPEVSLLQYGAEGHAFAEAAEAARRAVALLGEREGLYVAGSEPQVYWLAGRRAPTRYIYEYALTLEAGARAEVVDALRTRPPPVVVLAANASPWTRALLDEQAYTLADATGHYRILRRAEE